MLTPASPGYLDRALLGVALWTVRRLRSRGPLPPTLLEAAGLLRIVDGRDEYIETAGSWLCVRGVADAPPRRPDAWRRSSFWHREPGPPARPSLWFRRP